MPGHGRAARALLGEAGRDAPRRDRSVPARRLGALLRSVKWSCLSARRGPGIADGATERVVRPARGRNGPNTTRIFAARSHRPRPRASQMPSRPASGFRSGATPERFRDGTAHRGRDEPCGVRPLNLAETGQVEKSRPASGFVDEVDLGEVPAHCFAEMKERELGIRPPTSGAILRVSGDSGHLPGPATVAIDRREVPQRRQRRPRGRAVHPHPGADSARAVGRCCRGAALTSGPVARQPRSRRAARVAFDSG